MDKNKFKPPDFEALDRAAAEHDAQLEHISLLRYPELISVFNATIQSLNHIRAEVGVPAMPDDASIVRMMNHAQWSNLRSINPDDTDGYYDPLSGNTYQLLDEECYTGSSVARMTVTYTMAHELSHKATHGLEEYSFNLSEGTADYLAQYALENGSLSPIVNKQDLDAYRRRYLESGPILFNGYELREKDIFVAPGEAGSGFTRIPQLKLIEALQVTMHPEHFSDFLKGAFTSDIQLVKNVLLKHLGQELTGALEDTSDQTNPQNLTNRILQQRS